MLTLLLVFSAVAFFLVIPALVLKRYTRGADYNFSNSLWLVVGLVTWPLVPIGIAYLKRDKVLLSYLWVAFLFLVVSCSYWLVLHVEQYLALQATVRALLGG